MYLYIHRSDLFSLLSQFAIMYISFKVILQTFCLLLSEIFLFVLFVFPKIRQYFTRECSQLQCELNASSESLKDIAIVTKGGVA